ncbi:hypothetical protein [Bradyrhizobium sp. URHD0069]|uniref:hypothetical protein n=1 Tax=Bradyrhizobium sp. URHD0069 TaxID=1380355 RepID=UPI001FD8A19E|nr:hypothetical protein [Bradyrhizobium sp. URHD0069]
MKGPVPARDPQIAVQEEYEIARQRGTAQALELFISRQPDDTLIRGQNTKTIANLVIESTAF